MKNKRSWTYEERLRIPVEGSSSINLHTKSGLKISTGYNRIVIGERGPYIEFTNKHLDGIPIKIPRDCKWRQEKRYNAYYLEYRSIDTSYTMVYYQLREVKYADYKIGFYYISPFDLVIEDGMPLVKSIDEVTYNKDDFF